jgi:polyisoprenyl-phosphate glycosyltransferase
MPAPSTPAVSVVSPVFHGRETVGPLVRQIQAALSGAGLTYEIILVDDACPRDSWSAIRQVCAEYPEVTGLRLAENVGQHRALRAGLVRCRGDYIAVLDCDLQDDPASLPELVAKAREGFAVVYARRKQREPDSIRDIGAGAFYRIISLLSGKPPFDPRRGMYTVLHRLTLRILLARQDPYCRYLLTLNGLGLPCADVDVIRHARKDGKSSYSWPRLLRLSWQGVVSTSSRSQRWLLPAGFAMASVGFYLACLAAYRKGAWSSALPGWRSLIALTVAIGFFVSGLGLIARRLERSRSVPLKAEPYRIREILNESVGFGPS